MNKHLDFVAAVTRLRAAIFAANAIKGLYEISEAEWERCYDRQMDSHHIKDTLTSGPKSDAIIEYVTKVVGAYMNIVGTIPGTLSKESLASDNAITVAIIRRMGGIDLKSNRQLFDLVGSRLLGIDLDLVKASYTQDEVRYAHILKHLVGVQGEEFDEVAYAQPAGLLAKLDQSEQLNDEFYEHLIKAGIGYFANNGGDAMDLGTVEVLDDLLFDLVPTYLAVAEQEQGDAK